jgi:hypothetical protein
MYKAPPEGLPIISWACSKTKESGSLWIMGDIEAWASSKLKGIEKGDKNRVRRKSNS